MVARLGWLLSLGAIASLPAFGQAPAQKPTHKPARVKHEAEPATQLSITQTVTATMPAQPKIPRTLAEALAATYASQPALLAERARLRSTDENVPQALSGWRPTVVMAGTLGYGDGISRQFTNSSGGWLKARTDRQIGTAQATLTQPLYTGGRTQANLNRAKNQVMAERANLIAQEQTSFTNVGQRVCRRDSGPAIAGAEHQQRTGAGQTAAGHE